MRRWYFLVVSLLFLTILVPALPANPVSAAEPGREYYAAVIVDEVGGRLIVPWSIGIPGKGFLESHISIIDTDTGKVTSDINAPYYGLEVEPGTNHAYEVIKGTVLQLDLVTGKQSKIADLPPDVSAEYVVLNPVTGKLYAVGSNKAGNPVTVIVDIKLGTVKGTLPYRVLYAFPTMNRLYAVDTTYPREDRKLLALDAQTDELLPDGVLWQRQKWYPIESVDLDKTAAMLYINGGQVIIDCKTNQQIPGSLPLRSITLINEKENKIYGGHPDAGIQDTMVVDGTTFSTLGRWAYTDLFLGVDNSRNLVIRRSGLGAGTQSVVLQLIDGHTDTVKRRIVVTPPLTMPDAANPIAAFQNTADRVFFSQTGHSLSHGFKQYWERNGGLAVFGYPITEEFTERNRLGEFSAVQYFERAKFEYHPEYKDTPFEVELGLLGNQVAARRAPVAEAGTDSQHIYFKETGQYLSYGFKYYWERNGGLAVFGLPITGEFQEVNPIDGKTYTVQYFERARFEYHPEFKGTPYETELGLLGTQAVQYKGWQ
jgi:hypothetical protein